MAQLQRQISLEDTNAEYKEFVEKFKSKKTTDDCYTPPNIYEAVVSWVEKEYGVNRKDFVRPFWPGGDYERFDYPEGCVVVDNPPFSIISQICRTYMENGIRFFLFAPYLTNFSGGTNDVCHIITANSITYENGARVGTAFLTNLDECLVRSAPDLYRLIQVEDDRNRKEQTKQVPKYEYPDEVLTAAMVGYICKYGVDFSLRKEDAYFIRKLDDQDRMKKTIFGGGYLLSEKAAAEKAAAEKWHLSAREKEIINQLGRQ